MTLFVDTSVFYAAADRGDAGHARASEIISAGESIVTTDHVVVECWLLIQRRMSHETASRFWGGMRAGAARIESVLPADLEVAWLIGLAFADQEFSIVDRTSFAVMERVGVLRAASFDDDFAIYRFGRRRDRAFEVVR